MCTASLPIFAFDREGRPVLKRQSIEKPTRDTPGTRETHIMRKMILAVAFLVLLPTFSYGQSGFNGTWVTTDFKTREGYGKSYLTFKVDGTRATGTVSRQDAVTIRDGAVDGDTITFYAVYAAGERTVSFVGKLSGDTIAFTRSVKARDENGNSGTGLFGAKGPMQFTAKRDRSADTGVEAHYGDWKLSLAKSHYQPSPPLQPVEPEILAIRAVGDGQAELTVVSATETGAPTFAQTIFKTDGNAYPIYTQTALDTMVAGGKPTVRTNSMKVIDANTMAVTFKNIDGSGTLLTSVVSADGQTLTETWKDVDKLGKQTFSAVEVYDRIP